MGFCCHLLASLENLTLCNVTIEYGGGRAAQESGAMCSNKASLDGLCSSYHFRSDSEFQGTLLLEQKIALNDQELYGNCSLDRKS